LQAIAVAIGLLFIFDRVFYTTFPHFSRLRYNFSSAYLAREIQDLRGQAPVIVLGDSVLWGFGIDETQTAAARIRAAHPDWHNLAYAGGSPVNTLAMVRLLLASGVRPRAIVFNVNEKTFNPEDSAYQKLHPAVEELAYRMLTPGERAELIPVLATGRDAKLDRWLARFWQFYGMRADVRDAIFKDSDAAHALDDIVERLSGASDEAAFAHRPTPDKFEGTYDLDPVDASNVSFDALEDLAGLLKTERIPALAILTPTNHRLLHEYIDVPPYQRNLTRIRRVLEFARIRVLDLDSRFPANEFIDNDHLTAPANATLAALIERAMKT
jgi:hypothetical protein